MASVYLNEQSFVRLKSRYEAWKAAGFPDIDSGIQEILEHLNSIDGVVTVSSCVGHRATNTTPKTPFYIYVALRHAKALQVIQEIFAILAERLVEALQIYEENRRLARSISRYTHNTISHEGFTLSSGFKELTLDGGEVLTYCRWSLVAKGTHMQPQLDNFLKEFTACLDRAAPKEG